MTNDERRMTNDEQSVRGKMAKGREETVAVSGRRADV